MFKFSNTSLLLYCMTKRNVRVSCIFFCKFPQILHWQFHCLRRSSVKYKFFSKSVSGGIHFTHYTASSPWALIGLWLNFLGTHNTYVCVCVWVKYTATRYNNLRFFRFSHNLHTHARSSHTHACLHIHTYIVHMHAHHTHMHAYTYTPIVHTWILAHTHL